MDKSRLIEKVKEKKEFRGIKEETINEILENYIRKKKISLENLRISDEKIIVKEIRMNLRKMTGQYQIGSKNRKKLLSAGKIEKLLKTHTSTRERLEIYSELKNIISELEVKSILDLACGLNPLVLADKKIKYFASDIKQDELEVIEDFFKKNGIEGKTFYYDLRKISDDLPKADLCLLFKVLDILNDKKLAEKIILKVPCEKILVSFSTKKLSGKSMNFPKRTWFEKILSRNNFDFKVYNFSNEIFYLISKSSEENSGGGRN